MSDKKKIGTIDGLRSSSPDNDNDQPEYFVGGSERSGQMTVDPNDNSVYGRLLNSAERSANVGPASHTLHLWRNGFSINDEPLRSTDIEENKQMLEAITNHQLPPELAGIQELKIDDRRDEDFPKLPVKAFSGRGRMLGSPQPTLGRLRNAPIQSPNPISQHANSESNALKLNINEKKCTLGIRLPDGSQLRVLVNQDRHTIVDIRNYIVEIQSDLAFHQLDLYAGFPVPKLITNDLQTISECNLCNSVISVKALHL
ncbi:hypothetical protein GJ496_000331 [Pomphorhynchus laevis]|nr:hypothetical protein GJ496_000331 [Pomphorhynchus laevis]